MDSRDKLHVKTNGLQWIFLITEQKKKIQETFGYLILVLKIAAQSEDSALGSGSVRAGPL